MPQSATEPWREASIDARDAGYKVSVIAEACSGLDLQLVISLGGGQDPALLGDLPGDPVVVGYAPQLELIRRSALTISHGGLNTVLESLAQGVPMVVLPVAYDQPGVGARVEWSGVGRSIPIGGLTVDRLHDAPSCTDARVGARAHPLVRRLEVEPVERALIPHAQALEALALDGVRRGVERDRVDGRRRNTVVLLALSVQLRVTAVSRRRFAPATERIDDVALARCGAR